MKFSLRSLFCCLDGPRKDPKPRTMNPANTSSVNEEPNELSSADTTRDSDHNPHNRNQPDIIPLEYLNSPEPLPEEAAVTGRSRPSSFIRRGSHSFKQNDKSESICKIQSLQSFDEQQSQKSGQDDMPDIDDNNDRYDVQSPMSADPVAEIGEIDVLDDAMGRFGGDLLPPVSPELKDRKCLVLDLDETLVHSSFKKIWNADFVIPVEIEGTYHDVYVVKRPGVDEFLDRVSKLYEIVIFTASVSKYGDPLLDHLDPHRLVHHRLFRESCFNFHGNYIKNLVWLGRPLESTIIVDNSPTAYVLQPHNAVPISSWFSDVHDNELLDMLPFLEDLASQDIPNVCDILGHEW